MTDDHAERCVLAFGPVGVLPHGEAVDALVKAAEAYADACVRETVEAREAFGRGIEAFVPSGDREKARGVLLRAALVCAMSGSSKKWESQLEAFMTDP